MQSREQEYATKIYPQIEKYLTDKPEADQKKYGSMAHKLPILIRTAGLAQAISFVESRGLPPHQDLLTHLATIILNENSDAFSKRCRDAELTEYMALTEQTLLALSWYKRFAQSVLNVDITEGED